MSIIWPEEEELFPTRTRRFYDDDQGETARETSTALQDPRPEPAPRTPALSPEYTAAMAKVRQVLGERPERQRPSKWGAIAAMGIGAGAGLVNASGRTRIDPHTTQGAIDNLTGETGFRRRDEAWRRRLETAGQEAELAGSAEKARLAQEEFALDRRLKEAHAGAYEGQEARYRAQANTPQPVKPDRTILPRGAKLVENGQVVADNPIPSPTPVDRTPQTIRPGQGVLNKETGKYEVPIPAREPVDRSGQADERARKRAVSGAAATEQVDLQKVEQWFRTAKRALDADFSGGIDPKTKKPRPNIFKPSTDPVNKKFAADWQAVSDEYKRRTDELKEQLVQAKESAGSRRAASVAPYGEVYQPPKYRISRSELVRAAEASGKDPQLAIKVAEDKGFLLID